MANTNIEALKKQLEHYAAKIEKYEKEFLSNDGKIDAQEQNVLDSIRVMLDKVSAKLNKTQETTTSDGMEEIPAAFQKGFAQLKVATDKLEAKVKELKDSGNLEAVKDKLLAQIEKIRANFLQVELSFKNSGDKIQKECQEQLDILRQTLDAIKKQFSVKPISFEEKITKAKSQIQAILDRVAIIKGQFS